LRGRKKKKERDPGNVETKTKERAPGKVEHETTYKLVS
jgi:hypothetical protein